MCPTFALTLPCLKTETGSVIKLTLPVHNRSGSYFISFLQKQEIRFSASYRLSSEQV